VCHRQGSAKAPNRVGTIFLRYLSLPYRRIVRNWNPRSIQGSCRADLCLGKLIPSSFIKDFVADLIQGFLYEISLATVGWTVGSEIPALRMRSRTQGLGNVVLSFASWLMAFIFPYMFNPDTGNLVGKVGFVFGATTLVGFAGTFFLLPEGKDRTAAEMDILFERKIPTRQFHTTNVTVTEQTFLDGQVEQEVHVKT
jgi:hypothetical protein